MVAAGGIFKFHAFDHFAQEVFQRTGLGIHVYALGQLAQHRVNVLFLRSPQHLCGVRVGFGGIPLQWFDFR